MDQLSLVQPADRLSQGVVIAVAFAAHGRLDASLAQAFALPNGHVLGALLAPTEN